MAFAAFASFALWAGGSTPTASAVSGAALALTGSSVLLVAPAVATSPTLVQASPGIGAAADTPPGSVTLTFDLALKHGSLTVTGPGGDAGASSATINGTVLSEVLTSGLARGAYTVSWQAQAKTGPPSSGSYSFTVVGGSTGSPSPVTSTASVPASSGPGSGGSGSGGSGTGGGVPSASGTSLPGPGSVPAAVPTGLPGSSGAAPAQAVPTVTGSGPAAVPSDASRRGAGSSGDPSLTRAGVASPGAAAGRTSGSATVDALVSRSRNLAPWLIAVAVLIQAGTGLWGLWRWRRSTPQPASATSPGDVAPIDDEDLSPVRSADDLIWLDRPWTGEIPLHRASYQRRSVG